MSTQRRASPGPEEIRRQNLAALLRYVHRNGATSRAQLTKDLGLNRSTIGALTADLTTAGLVGEEIPRETARTRAGRPSLVVRAQANSFYTYALSIEVDQIKAARIGLGGEILDLRSTPRTRDQEAPQTAEPAAALVRDMHTAAPPQAVCVGCGVVVCGMVRQADGLIRLSPNTGWVDEPFADALRRALRRGTHGQLPPITVGNVAEAAALAEHTRGAASRLSNIIYLHGDVGIGAGIITGGRGLSGQSGYAGEVGHMVVHPGGRACGCGSRGCWETEIGERALLETAGRGDQTGRDAVESVVDAARRGDAAADHAIKQVGDWLGFGVGNLVNIFNPEVVLFGGTLRDVYIAAAATVRTRLNKTALPVCREHLRLRTPELGGEAALIGAAEMAFEALLSDPLSTSGQAISGFDAS